MKNNRIPQLMALCITLFTFTMGCNAPATDTAAKAVESTKEMASKPDMAKVKSEIQALENEWAAASNKRDVATILAFYADDAVSLPANKPIVAGKAAIEKDIKADFEKRKPEAGDVAFETTVVFGNDKLVTEIGKATVKDAKGKVTYTGKYMAIWEKRNGKWLDIRDIGNDDVKEK